MPDNLDALRAIEGFPIGEDEDLLALSDPPHYTAYPNPYITEFIQKWGKPYDEVSDDYHREPYVADRTGRLEWSHQMAESHISGSRALCFHPSGTLLAVGETGRITIWRLPQGKLASELRFQRSLDA
jgi:hypothetical protein